MIVGWKEGQWLCVLGANDRGSPSQLSYIACWHGNQTEVKEKGLPLASPSSSLSQQISAPAPRHPSATAYSFHHEPFTIHHTLAQVEIGNGNQHIIPSLCV